MKLRVAAALSAVILAWPAFGQVPIDQLAKPPADAKIWTITSGDGTVPHGQIALWTDKQGTHWSRESLNLRGIVTEIDEQNHYAAGRHACEPRDPRLGAGRRCGRNL